MRKKVLATTTLAIVTLLCGCSTAKTTQEPVKGVQKPYSNENPPATTEPVLSKEDLTVYDDLAKQIKEKMKTTKDVGVSEDLLNEYLRATGYKSTSALDLGIDFNKEALKMTKVILNNIADEMDVTTDEVIAEAQGSEKIVNKVKDALKEYSFTDKQIKYALVDLGLEE